MDLAVKTLECGCIEETHTSQDQPAMKLIRNYCATHQPGAEGGKQIEEGMTDGAASEKPNYILYAGIGILLLVALALVLFYGAEQNPLKGLLSSFSQTVSSVTATSTA